MKDWAEILDGMFSFYLVSPFFPRTIAGINATKPTICKCPVQASKLLSQLDAIPMAVAARLEKANIQTARDLFNRTPFELVDLLDLEPEAIRVLFQTVSQAIAPQPQSALSLYRQRAGSGRLSTLVPPLDAALSGGVAVGSITEIVGPAGLGKTQFCLGMCISACLDRNALDSKVMYIDTEGKFSATRLAQMATSRFPRIFSSQSSETLNRLLLDRILLVRVSSTAELMDKLASGFIQATISDHSVKLLVLDSIASLVRIEFGTEQLVQRQKLLGQQASRLKFIAESFQIPVVVTNQVTSSTLGLTAALGPMWAHAVNTRLVVAAEMMEDADFNYSQQQIRTITIAKSPAAPMTCVAYRVTTSGVEWDQENTTSVASRKPVQGSVLDMIISNYQKYETSVPDVFNE